MLMSKELQNQSMSDNRKRDLLLSIAFDAVGMLSFSIPLIGEFSDVVWAPISAFLMMQMYKGGQGKLAGMFSFLEEIIPLTDFIPSFTLMWLYTYVFTKKQY
jgi:hypothetical protein